MESAFSLSPYVAEAEMGRDELEEKKEIVTIASAATTPVPATAMAPALLAGTPTTDSSFQAPAFSHQLQLPFSNTPSALNSAPYHSSPIRDPIATTTTPAPASTLPPDDLRQEQPSKQTANDIMSDNQVKEGDKVSWQWSGSKPSGEVSEVKEDGKVEMETKNNNTVSKNGEPGNPALYIERSGHDVVKKANEVDVEKSAGGKKDDKADEKKDEKADEKKDEKAEEKKAEKSEEKKENGDAETGDKRKAEEPAEEKKAQENGDDSKKQKKDDKPKENGEPKKKGRPAKKANGEAAPKKDAKKKEPKKAATESGEPRRSGRNRS